MTDKSTADRILSAALKIFSEQGYDGATVRDISSRAGVHSGAINYYFSSKENLYCSLFTEYTGTKYRMLLQIFADCDDLGHIEEYYGRIRTFFRQFVSILFENRELYVLIEREIMQGMPLAGEEIERIMRPLTRAIIDFLLFGIEKGWVREDVDAQASLFGLYSLLFHPIMQRALLRKFHDFDINCPEDRDRYYRTAAGIFIRGIRRNCDHGVVRQRNSGDLL